MTNMDEKWIRDFIEKNYRVHEYNFFNRDNEHEWGVDIVDLIKVIFNVDEDSVTTIFRNWASNYLNEAALQLAWGKRKLRAHWLPEMAQDLMMYGVENGENQLTKLLADEVAKEINSEILKKLSVDTTNYQELQEVLNCVGYEISNTTIYDQNTFVPKNIIQSINYNKMMKARRLSDIYEKHFPEEK